MSSVTHQIPAGAVSICGNGHVTLHFGRAIIHLSLEEFQAFLNASAEALVEFGELPGKQAGHSGIAMRH